MNFKEKCKGIIGKDVIAVFFAAISFRVIVYIISALIMALQTSNTMSFSLENFFGGWTRWDASHYIKIAELGYCGAIEDGKHLFLVFFPLFPYLMRAVSAFVGNTAMAGMIVSTLTYAGGCVYLYKIGKKYGGQEVGRNLALLVAMYPFAFFFGGIMTESLFLFLSAATLYYLDEHKWWWAVLFGALATMTRIQGVLLGIPALVEAFLVYRPIQALKEKAYSRIYGFIGRCASFLLMLTGLAYYLWVNYRVEGDPFRFLYYQESHWHQGHGNIVKTIKYIFDYSFREGYDVSTRMALWVPQMILILISAGFLIFSIKKIRPMYYLYGAAYIYLTFSASWLLSSGRYFACNIPLFLVIAVGGAKKKSLVWMIAILFAMLQMIYLGGFLHGRQIM